MPQIKYMTLNIKNINILFVYEVDVHNKCCDHSLLSFRTLTVHKPTSWVTEWVEEIVVTRLQSRINNILFCLKNKTTSPNH